MWQVSSVMTMSEYVTSGRVLWVPCSCWGPQGESAGLCPALPAWLQWGRRWSLHGHWMCLWTVLSFHHQSFDQIRSPSHTWKPLILNFSPPLLENLWFLRQFKGMTVWAPLSVWAPSRCEWGCLQGTKSFLQVSRTIHPEEPRRPTTNISMFWLYLAYRVTVVFCFWRLCHVRSEK